MSRMPTAEEMHDRKVADRHQQGQQDGYDGREPVYRGPAGVWSDELRTSYDNGWLHGATRRERDLLNGSLQA